MKVIHLNIQSISNKIHQLEIIVSKEKPDLLCLSEHWMQELQAKVTTIHGYKLLSYYCRSNTTHGGVAIYGRLGTKFKVISIPKNYTGETVCECCAVSTLENNIKLAVLAIYRSPRSDLETFFNLLHNILTYISTNHQHIILCGDFNVNYLIDNKNKSLLNDLFQSFELTSCLPSEPSRIFNNSESQIDFVVSNLGYIESCNVDYDISDHLAQICIFDIAPNANYLEKPVSYWKRDLSKQNLSHLSNLLQQTDFSEIYAIQDVEMAYAYFWTQFYYCLDATCPKIKIKTKLNYHTKSWVNKNIICESEQLKNLFWMYKNTGLDELRQAYLEAKMQFSLNICETKKTFYENIIKNASNANKATWQIVNNNMDRNKHKNDEKLTIFNNNKNVSDEFEISNLFCKYFVSIAKEAITSEFGNYAPDIKSRISKTNLNSMSFEEIEPNEIIAAVQMLNNRTSTGPDEINFNIINTCIKYVAQPLCHIMNLSISTGYFPSALKLAYTTPLHKNGDTHILENYRAITQNSYLSKLFEKIVHNRMYDYLMYTQQLTENQHGFRPKHSTDTATFDFLQFIYESLDENRYVIAILFDLTKAFDSVDHKMLLKKLDNMGIRGNLNNWVGSFLESRKLIVKVNNSFSDAQDIQLGVPQGAVLSPLLFIIFINDLENYFNDLTPHIKIIMYADDVTISVSASTEHELQYIANKILNHFSDWCIQNRQLLNANKTNYIQFSIRRDPPKLHLAIKNYTVTKTEEAKFLGLTLDEKLSWETHINNVSHKISSAFFALRNLKNIISTAELINVYYGIVYPHIKYLILLWGSRSSSQRIFIMQKRIIRLIFSLGPLESCRPIFKKKQNFNSSVHIHL